MYTNAGVLGVIGVRNAAANLGQTRAALDAVEKGEMKLTEREFEALVRLEEDIKTFFLHRAEALGMTNVANNAMRSF